MGPWTLRRFFLLLHLLLLPPRGAWAGSLQNPGESRSRAERVRVSVRPCTAFACEIPGRDLPGLELGQGRAGGNSGRATRKPCGVGFVGGCGARMRGGVRTSPETGDAAQACPSVSR